MALFSILAKLGLDGSGFEAGAKRAQSAASKLGGNIKAQLGAALAFSSLVAFTKSVITLADEIGDLSEQMNISTDDVQRLQVVAGQTGVKFETISKGLVNLGQARLKAVEGAGKERTAFELLGLSLEEVNNANVTNITTAQKLQVAFEASGKSAETQAAMIDIFGVKAFQAALALNSLKTLGPIELIKNEDIKKLGEINDKLDEQYRILKTKSVPIITSLTKALIGLFEATQITDPKKAQSQIGRMMQAQTMAGSSMVNGVITDESKFVGPLPTDEELQKSLIAKQLGSEKITQAKKIEQAKTQANFALGQGADSFAKIGGFGMFQSSQDRMIDQLKIQVDYLKMIRDSSKTTADVVKGS